MKSRMIRIKRLEDFFSSPNRLKYIIESGITRSSPSYLTKVAKDANANDMYIILGFLLMKKERDDTKSSMNRVRFDPETESKINLGSNANIAAPINA